MASGEVAAQAAKTEVAVLKAIEMMANVSARLPSVETCQQYANVIRDLANAYAVLRGDLERDDERDVH